MTGREDVEALLSVDPAGLAVADGPGLHDVFAEQSALGGVLLGDRDALEDVTEACKPSDFWLPRHVVIARAIGRLQQGGQPVDVLTVGDELLRSGELAAAGGAEYLHELAGMVPTSANAGYYASIVHDRRVRRDLRVAGVRIAQAALSGSSGALELVDRARAEVDAVAGGISVEASPIGDAFLELVDSLDSSSQRFVPTPWADVNRAIGGLRPGGLYVVGARPGSGKTIMGLQIAAHVAERAGAVAFASLEMSRFELASRLIALRGEVDLGRVMRQQLTREDWERIARVRPWVERLPLSVLDAGDITVTAVRGHARATRRRFGHLGAVVVDYLQLMSGTGDDRRRSRAEVVAEFSRGLKLLARELGVPVIALSQLNRASESRESRRPTMADLRESGAIEQDADVVMLLHRDEDAPDQLEVIVAKNRHGEAGRVRLLWEGRFARVRDVERGA